MLIVDVLSVSNNKIHRLLNISSTHINAMAMASIQDYITKTYGEKNKFK